MAFKVCIVCFVVAVCWAAVVGAEKCSESKDAVTCWKNKVYKAVHQDQLEFGGISIVANGQPESAEARASSSILDDVIGYVRTHDLRMPVGDATLSLSGRSIDLGKLDLNVKYHDTEDEEEDDVEEEGRSKIKHKIKHGIKKIKKSKLKKLIVPIVIIIMLKAITFIPLIIGILGIKAFNALQLGFGSFLLSFGIAAFQLCQKLTEAFHRKQFAWPAAARSDDAASVQGGDFLAYRAYA